MGKERGGGGGHGGQSLILWNYHFEISYRPPVTAPLVRGGRPREQGGALVPGIRRALEEMFCLIGSDGRQYTDGIPPFNDMPNSNTVSNFGIIPIMTGGGHFQHTQTALAPPLCERGTESGRLQPLAASPSKARLAWQDAHENRREEL